MMCRAEDQMVINFRLSGCQAAFVFQKGLHYHFKKLSYSILGIFAYYYILRLFDILLTSTSVRREP